MPDETWTYAIPATLIAVLSPLGGFLLSAIIGKRTVSRALSILSISCSLAASALVFSEVWGHGHLQAQWTWFTIGEHTLRVGILLDNLSVVMLLLVPLIALPVHIYSIAYMSGDSGAHRYWMFLSLFCSAMLGLVVADNLLLMYVFWELVGFASYLLIGYWFTKDSAAKANMKAFIVNRIGDVGLLIGIALVYAQFGSLDIQHLFGEGGAVDMAIIQNGFWQFGSQQMPAIWLTITGLAFFLGAMAKSAQFPLHVWLTDAMEGPTSVSSLIHAATMVAAGVFLLARLFPLFDATVLVVIAWIGTITALLAAYFALTQNDIKKILAFSTISQLGLMMVAVGTGNVEVAIFYLVIHAFFKCLLFLGAGAVIHQLHAFSSIHQQDFDPQDIRNMGDLRKSMPITAVVMVIAALALAGVPLTAGYLSKDLLLLSSFAWGISQGGIFLLIPFLLMLVSAMTSFYILRYIFKIFFATSRIPRPSGNNNTPREAPLPMWIPMIFLGCCSLFILFAKQPLQVDGLWLVEGLSGSTRQIIIPSSFNVLIPLITLLVTAVVAGIAWRWYVRGPYSPKETSFLYRFSYRQGYIEEVYQTMLVNPFVQFSGMVKAFDLQVVDGTITSIARAGQKLASVVHWIDYHIVDGFVRFIGKAAIWLGNVLRRSQTGRVQYYVYLMFSVILLVLIYYLVTLG